MFSPSDTIVALATPPGRGGLGIVRLSGPDAHRIGCGLLQRRSPLTARHATVGRLLLTDQIVEHVVTIFFERPHSFTAEDVIEISAHGSPVVLDRIVHAALEAGARLARPGEFTFRAFLNGRIDLTQAEAVADLIDAMTPRQARAASAQLDGGLAMALRELDTRLFDLIAQLEASLDFPDEGYHFIEAGTTLAKIRGLNATVDELLTDSTGGRILRDGARVVLTGRPNVGKSSIFNRLSQSDRAIVTPIPGTTRDVLIEAVDLDGVPVLVVDTAGLREANDQIEEEGIRRATDAASAADLVVAVFDRSHAFTLADRQVIGRITEKQHLLIANKCDLPREWDVEQTGADSWVEISCTTGEGFDGLVRAITEALSLTNETADSPRTTNSRHISLLHQCSSALERACSELATLGASAPEEVILIELNEARQALDEISGRRTSEDVLNRIFDRFCIGK